MDRQNTNNLGRQFYDQQWGDERIRVHSLCVIDSCRRIAADQPTDQDVFIIAGWIHDLGRKASKEDHHNLSIPFLTKFLSMHPQFRSLEADIKDCILNHRTAGQPTTPYGIIFQQADKEALKDPRWAPYARYGHIQETNR